MQKDDHKGRIPLTCTREKSKTTIEMKEIKVSTRPADKTSVCKNRHDKATNEKTREERGGERDERNKRMPCCSLCNPPPVSGPYNDAGARISLRP